MSFLTVFDHASKSQPHHGSAHCKTESWCSYKIGLILSKLGTSPLHTHTHTHTRTHTMTCEDFDDSPECCLSCCWGRIWKTSKCHLTNRSRAPTSSCPFHPVMAVKKSRVPNCPLWVVQVHGVRWWMVHWHPNLLHHSWPRLCIISFKGCLNDSKVL